MTEQTDLTGRLTEDLSAAYFRNRAFYDRALDDMLTDALRNGLRAGDDRGAPRGEPRSTSSSARGSVGRRARGGRPPAPPR